MLKNKKIKIGIIGASGYTAQELTALLAADKNIEIVFLHSKSQANQKSEFINLKLENLSREAMLARKPDVVFFATPNGVAMNEAPYFLKNKIKVIDISADFRFKNLKTFEKTYNLKHASPENKAVFGLTEIFEKQLKNANLIANPGCYVTACLLALYPIQTKIKLAILDVKSGYSGAGKKFDMNQEIKNNFLAYKITNHRHEAEIQQFIKSKIYFTPHLLPFFRGLEATCHIILKPGQEKLDYFKFFKNYYKNQPQIKIQKEIPGTKDAQGTNKAILGGFEIDAKGRLVIISVLDNLRKGAASQAIQNLHAIYGLTQKIAEPKKYLK